MRRGFLLSIAVLFSSISFVSAQPQAVSSPGPDRFPDVVAKVNDTEIKKADLLRRAEMVKSQLSPTDVGADFYQRVLADMIGAELLYQSVEKKGLMPTEQEVEAELQSQKGRFGAEEEFQKALTAQGMTIEGLRRQLKKEMGIENFIQKQLASQVTVTDQEKRKFFEENQAQMKHPLQFRAAHILIRVDPKATPEQKAEAKKKASAIRSMVEAGQDFADLAKRNSDDPGSKDKGGELPWMGQGQTVPAFETAALALSPGGLSDVVETQFGYHVIRLLEKREAGTSSFEEVQDRIGEFLQRRGVQQRIQTEVDSLRSQGKVEVFI